MGIRTFDRIISSRREDEAIVVENGLLATVKASRRSINKDATTK